MERDILRGKMEENIEVSSKMIKDTVKVCLDGKMEEYTKVDGAKVNSMGLATIRLLIRTPLSRESGRTENG